MGSRHDRVSNARFKPATPPGERGELEAALLGERFEVATYKPPTRHAAPHSKLDVTSVHGEGYLPDAAVVSLPSGYETVLGNDDRARVVDTSQAPNRWIARLEITVPTDGGTRTFLGTGWFAGPRTVVTAAHCLYFHKYGAWASEILVVPAQAAERKPYGAGERATRFEVADGWVSDRLQECDYGVIQLASPVGDRVGWFGIAAPENSATLRSRVLHICGYPSDRDDGRSQFYHARQVSRVTETLLWYTNDTAQGQSGSPVWLAVGDDRYAVGIHNQGIWGDRESNTGTRITRPVYENLIAWIDHP